MANTFLTPQEITFESLMILRNNCKAAINMYDGYSKEFGKKGHKIGDTLNVRKPARYVGGDGQDYSPEAMTEAQVPITINNYSHVHMEFDSRDLALSLDDFSRRHIKPASIALANKIDYRALTFAYQNTANAVGTPGTTPSTNLVYLQAGQKLDEMGAPTDDERYLFINAAMRVSIANANLGAFNPQSDISKIWKTGRFQDALGFSWFQDQNVNTYTSGVYGGTPLVNGANQSGNSLITNGWTATTTILQPGDRFTIANVNAVNPQSRVSNRALQQFVVTSVSTTDGSGNSTLTIAPAIVGPGSQFQNVDSLPASGAAITPLAATATVTTQGMAWHRTAFALMSASLEVPKNVDMGYEATDPDTGVSVRFTRAWDPIKDRWINRLDTIYGFGSLYPELACAING